MIAAETQPTSPNAVYPAMVIFQTGINASGKLRTSMQITYSDAVVTNEGEANEAWVNTGRSNMVMIDDIGDLPQDIAAGAALMTAMKAAIYTVVSKLNQIRKVL